MCKQNSRSQFGTYSGLQTVRTKMRERAGQMEEGSRQWIELGGRKTCWKRESLTHLRSNVSILEWKMVGWDRLTVAFAGKLVQRKLSVAWEREIPARARWSLDARLLVYRNKPSLECAFLTLGSKLQLGAGHTFGRPASPADAQTIHHRPSTSHANLVTDSLCRYFVNRSI